MTHESVLSEPRLPPALRMGVLNFSQARAASLLLRHLRHLHFFHRISTKQASLGQVSGDIGRPGGVPTLPFSPKCGFSVGPESVVGTGAAVTCEWWPIPWAWKVPGSLLPWLPHYCMLLSK